MTREQAIKILKPIRDTYVDHANIAMTVEADNNADALEMAIEALQQPEIIHCKDCKYNVSSHKCLHPESFFLVPDDDFYCGYAERRTDAID